VDEKGIGDTRHEQLRINKDIRVLSSRSNGLGRGSYSTEVGVDQLLISEGFG
jgi:hypothetical protein